MPETDSSQKLDSPAVGAAVREGIGHRPKRGAVGLARTEVEAADESAHDR
jgi:hypothetical protein